MSYSPPKYYQISRKIISQIKSGKLETGHQIPSENEMISKYNISNTTARKVLMELEVQGFATKIRGKGTFVRASSVDRSVTKILSFTKNMQDLGLTPSTKVLESVIIKEDISKVISGKLYILKKPLLKIKRLRLADNIPIMVEERYISLHVCKGIEKMNLENPLYDIYSNKFNLQISRIEQSLSSIILDDSLLELFGLNKMTTGFKVEGVSFYNRGSIIEMENSIYRGDRYKFYVEAIS